MAREGYDEHSGKADARKAKHIKKNIDELCRRWDHLDEENYQTHKQLQISGRIGKAQETLKKLTGETY